MKYAGPTPVLSSYGVYQMRESERKECLSWLETKVKDEVFDKRRVLERYCQADETV